MRVDLAFHQALLSRVPTPCEPSGDSRGGDRPKRTALGRRTSLKQAEREDAGAANEEDAIADSTAGD
jgi:hypothetical protein